MQNQSYKINTGFIVDKVGDDTVIFDGERSILHTFNETAYFIFKLIKKGHSRELITKKIVEAYHIDRQLAQKDLDLLINFLLTKKIISERDD